MTVVLARLSASSGASVVGSLGGHAEAPQWQGHCPTGGAPAASRMAAQNRRDPSNAGVILRLAAVPAARLQAPQANAAQRGHAPNDDATTSCIGRRLRSNRSCSNQPLNANLSDDARDGSRQAKSRPRHHRRQTPSVGLRCRTGRRPSIPSTSLEPGPRVAGMASCDR